MRLDAPARFQGGLMVRLAIPAAAALLFAQAACKKNPTAPAEEFDATDPVLLSTNSPTKDEDPSVLLLPSGKILVAWFSDRGNNPDIYVASTTDRVNFTSPVRVTSGTGGDFYPNFYLDGQGTIHLVWFQWVSLFVGQIRHATSTDGVTWSPEEAVTTDLLVDDWVPSMTQAADGTLLVYFVSDKRDPANPTNEIYVAAKPPGATAWNPAVPVAGVNSATLHDHLPFAARIGGQIGLVWVRHDTRNLAPWLTPSPKSDLFYATSTDGRTFANAVQITRESGDVVNVFPAIYRKHDDSWSIEWLSTRAGSATVYEIPVARIGEYPRAVTEAAWFPPGYSHRLTRTAVPGEYLGAWVQGPEGSQEIYWRTITR